MKEECNYGACKPRRCNNCNKIKSGFVNVLDGKFYCVDCINKSWNEKEIRGIK